MGARCSTFQLRQTKRGNIPRGKGIFHEFILVRNVLFLYLEQWGVGLLTGRLNGWTEPVQLLPEQRHIIQHHFSWTEFHEFFQLLKQINEKSLKHLCSVFRIRSVFPLVGIGTPPTRVGNFRQKNNSAEDGIDGTNGYFRRNSSCSAEQKISEFRSEPFRGRENNSEFCSVEQK